MSPVEQPQEGIVAFDGSDLILSIPIASEDRAKAGVARLADHLTHLWTPYDAFGQLDLDDAPNYDMLERFAHQAQLFAEQQVTFRVGLAETIDPNTHNIHRINQETVAQLRIKLFGGHPPKRAILIR